ncbi:MAG: response regulator [Candidatus Delongbacteria bacterium]|nr:response regulator [Candidatus Delongbacteria bacterium]MCG2760875.1 response regulator [Candidatus Delongbacteria bacterium]
MGKKILIIDDQQEVLEVLAQILKIYNHEVVAITSGHNLDKKFQMYNFDLVITDYLMPDMTGIDIAKKIKCKYAGTKVYIISGYHKLLSDEKMVEYGICGFLNKPFDMEELKRIVNE